MILLHLGKDWVLNTGLGMEAADLLRSRALTVEWKYMVFASQPALVF